MFRRVLTLPASPSVAPPDPVGRAGKRRARRRYSTLGAAGMALAAGLFHATSWLWPGLGAGTWIGHALLIALGTILHPRAALVWGMLAGGVGIGLSFSWGVSTLQSTLDASPAAALALFTVLVAVEAVPFALTALTASLALRRGPAALWYVACVWTALEWLYPRLFGWRLAYSQLEWPPLLQIAELAGSTSVGFVMTAAAAIPAVLWKFARPSSSPATRRAACLYAWLAGGLLIATLGYGQVRLGQLERWLADQPPRTIGLVQIDPALVGSEEKLRRASFTVHATLDWLCWPETALGTYCETLGDFRDRDQVRRLSRDSYQSLQPAEGLACPLLAGGRLYGPQAGPEGPYAMAALLIGPDQTIWGKYRKRTLMPLGEYVPGQRWLPQLRHWATIADELVPGDDPRPVVTASGERLGVLLCYEDTLPHHARETVACGAQLLVSLIQGTAFEHPRTLVQHQRLAVLRAVENRRYFARCASTGVTCIISPTGRVVGELPLFAEGVLRGRVVLLDHRTPYSRCGEWFPLACVLGLAAVGGRSVWRSYWACRK